MSDFYSKYWDEFLATMKARPDFPLKLKKGPITNNYLTWNCFGRKGFKLIVSLQENADWICVNFGIDSKDQKHHFKALAAKQYEINNVVGEKIRWQPMGNERSNTQAVLTKYHVDVQNRLDWAQQHSWMLDHLEKFHEAFKVHVDALEE